MSLKLLLLQARHSDDPMAAHEHQCFAARCEVEPEQIHLHDLLEGPPTLGHARHFDALLIGGSGDFYISKGNLPQHEGFLQLLRDIIDVRHPMFASCFGYQAVVQALGGEIIHDPDNTEVGTFVLELTEAGKRDPLLGELNESFNAQLGHKDRANVQPSGIDNLASSERSPLQALRIHEAPIWATQFHPELDRATNLERFERYLDGYAAYMSEEDREAARKSFLESPGASALLKRFLDLVFG